MVDRQAVAEERHRRRMGQAGVLQVERAGDVGAAEHDRSGALAAGEAEVAVDLGLRRGEAGQA